MASWRCILGVDSLEHPHAVKQEGGRRAYARRAAVTGATRIHTPASNVVPIGPASVGTGTLTVRLQEHYMNTYSYNSA